MAKKRYIKAKIELIKVELNLLNDVSGSDMPWGVKRNNNLLDEEFDNELEGINEETSN